MSRFIPSTELLALRQEIDALDQKIATLLCERLLLIHQAATLKPRKEDVRLEDRIEEIISKISPISANFQLDAQYLERIYRFLIEESIARESQEWDKIQG